MADFNSRGFKMLWEIEKDINVDELKRCMCKKLKLKEKVIMAVPDAVTFYE